MLGFGRRKTAKKPLHNNQQISVNWDRMRELAEEAEELMKKNLWTLEEYKRVNQEALKAGGAKSGARDWLLHLAEEEWLKYILKTPPKN